MVCVKRRSAAATAVLLFLFLASCSRGAKDNGQQSGAQPTAETADAISRASEFSDTIEIRYAKGLAVNYAADGIHVVITDPDPAVKHATGTEIIITHPASRFVCTTALQLGCFEALGLEDHVVGINSLRSLFSPVVKERIERGETTTIGREGVFDVEAVIAAQPDYILVSSSKYGGYEALKSCGIPIVPHHGYRECDPLGQAEWVKLVGLLTGETRRANAAFASIEEQYLRLKREVESLTTSRPTVASGRQLREGWYAVGGRSYMATIFRDAGARYVMEGNTASGGTTLDFEAAFALMHDADFWQTDGKAPSGFSLATLAQEDARYATMRAYEGGRVLFCNLAETPYRELAGVQPHIVLADFVHAFHPELLPDYEPHYYKELK